MTLLRALLEADQQADTMLFVGVDLTSAFSAKPRPNDIAVLGDSLETPIRFAQARWPAVGAVTGRDAAALDAMIRTTAGGDPDQVWALDGPQGLARAASSQRRSEVLLCTPAARPPRSRRRHPRRRSRDTSARVWTSSHR